MTIFRIVTAATVLTLFGPSLEMGEIYAGESGGAVAASGSKLAENISSDNDKTDWYSDLNREIQGLPKENDRRCNPVSQPVTDVHGRLIGYHTFNVCK